MVLTGSQARVYISTVSTAMTAEPLSLVSGKLYRITDADKRVINSDAAHTVFGNAIAIAIDDIERIDYLTGEVEFKAAYTPTTPITITGSYFPMVIVGDAKEYSTSVESDVEDCTVLGDTTKRNKKTLMGVSGSFGALGFVGNQVIGASTLLAKAEADEPVVLRFYFDLDGTKYNTTRAHITTLNSSTTVAGLGNDEVVFVSAAGDSATPRTTRWWRRVR